MPGTIEVRSLRIEIGRSANASADERYAARSRMPLNGIFTHCVAEDHAL